LETLENGLAGELRDVGWFDPTTNNVYQGRVGDTSRKIYNVRNPKQAALPSLSDISAVNIPILLQEIVGLQRPVYNLRNICRVINMNALKATIPIYTKGTATEMVPPLVEASLDPDAWSTVTFALWKNVQHIVVSDELQKLANVDIFGTATRDAAGALAYSENHQIAVALAAATTAGSTAMQTATVGNWATVTSGRSAYSPYQDIIIAATKIATAGFRPTGVLCAPKGWSAFFGNDFVKGQLAGAVYPDFTQGGGFPIPGLPGMMGYSDFFMTPATSCYVMDQVSGIVLGAGPTEAARYRNEAAGYDAYIMRQYLQPQSVGLTTTIQEVTGVVS
jgi:hypothetical protein